MKLLHKLHQHGVRGNTLVLDKGLSDWVLSNSCTGGWNLIGNSCQLWSPQGSAIGPWLFLLYINDLPQNIHSQSQVWLFADDTAICITINNHSDSDTLQQGLDTLQTWECLWDMDFNLSKCQVLHISKSRHPAQHIYMLHGQVLEAMDHTKYLGVDISKDLSWNTHINRISTNANRTLGFLKRNIKTKNTVICTADTKPWSALKSNTHPQYGALSLKPTLIRLRWSKEGPCAGSTALFHICLISWGQKSRCSARLILFYKIVYNLVAVPLPQYINHPVRVTRHMHPLHFVQIPAIASYYKYSFFPLAIVQWNRLPHHIPVLSDLDSFRSAVRKVSHLMP